MAKYNVIIKASAAKELEAIKSMKDRIAIVKKIDSLGNNPRPTGAIKLSDQEKFRIRHGNYRILYQIFDEQVEIIVVKIGHRKSVYKSRR